MLRQFIKPGLSFSASSCHLLARLGTGTELVISKMNQLLSRTPALSPQRPLTTQQPQSGTLKDPDSSKTPPQLPPPQGCLQYILDCNGIAVGPKQVQAS
uniref:Macaca fascicularis brain cDNA clone: QflA-19149, similar to human synapsin II (SYN2), transcript variant IIb, mRNA, RefSeq: NM_003178.3 n=1 Tax=Macaca fascicularis TaxID=9541 RepID=I7GLQ5_MACFA|nr:unnamed protein product [Macaca fascicularis]